MFSDRIYCSSGRWSSVILTSLPQTSEMKFLGSGDHMGLPGRQKGCHTNRGLVSPLHPYEGGIGILQIQLLKIREVRCLSQGHIARKCQSEKSKLSWLIPQLSVEVLPCLGDSAPCHLLWTAVSTPAVALVSATLRPLKPLSWRQVLLLLCGHSSPIVHRFDS